MERVETYGALEEVASADLNTWQDNSLGIAQAPYIIVGCPYVYCTDGTNLKISGITGLVLPGFPNGNYSTAVESTYNPVAALSADTWYYLYAFSNAGTIAFGETTTPPNNALTTLGANQRYLTCFRTDGSGNIRKFRCDRGDYLWDFSGEASNDFRVLNSGTATSFTDVSLSTFVPPHARMAKIKAILRPTFNEVSDGEIRTNGATGGAHTMRLFGSSLDSGSLALDTKSLEIDLLTDSSQLIEYKVASTNPGVIMIIHVLGFRE
jgi:hypothetical protein